MQYGEHFKNAATEGWRRACPKQRVQHTVRRCQPLIEKLRTVAFSVDSHGDTNGQRPREVYVIGATAGEVDKGFNSSPLEGDRQPLSRHRRCCLSPRG